MVNEEPVEGAGAPDAEEMMADSGAVASDEATGETTGENAAEGGAAEAPSPDPAEVIARLESELATAQSQAAEHLEKLQRHAADFQNSKRRQERQLGEAIDRAAEGVIVQLLPILDDLDLAFNNLPADVDDKASAWVGGFRQIQKKLMAVLEAHEVQPIPLEGPFDPSRQEAVTSEPSDTVESGHVIATLRTGYEHKGRVLRPALVRVAS